MIIDRLPVAITVIIIVKIIIKKKIMISNIVFPLILSEIFVNIYQCIF